MRIVVWAMLAYAAQEPVTIRVPVRLVTAPTLVFTEDGRPLTDLKLSDFHLYDNERLQEITVESGSAPVSVAMVVQTSVDVRAYVPFIAKAGSVVESLVAGDGGESALLVYNSDVKVLKRFGSGDLQKALRTISPGGLRARSLDAGMEAVRLLAERPSSRQRVLLLIGQPLDDGSETKLAALLEEAEKQNVTVFALALPEIGKNFISDNFSLEGLPREGGGFIASTDLLKVISALTHAGDAAAGADPFSTLTAATAGGQFHFRRQAELEGSLAAVGVQLRSSYQLSYYANTAEAGKHKIRVEVDVPGAKVRTRPEW